MPTPFPSQRLSDRLPIRLNVEDRNEYNVLLNALQTLSEELPDNDEDQPVIARLIEKVEAVRA